MTKDGEPKRIQAHLRDPWVPYLIPTVNASGDKFCNADLEI